MRAKPLIPLVAGVLVGLLGASGSSPGVDPAQGASTPPLDVTMLTGLLDTVRSMVPDQAHVMADVDYHFSNLWFAAQNANWPLATFYLDETKSHLNWAVRVRPKRRLSSGQELDLRAMLQGLENSSLAQLRAALEKRDPPAFAEAYRKTLAECYACHAASEKPYLRPRIPETPASHIMTFSPKPD